jgi:YD repeat-containing protein
VTYPDDTPGDAADNPVRAYHYEDATFANALTGITDENGNRFATWAYDSQGRTVSSTHAGGAGSSALTYNSDGTTTLVDSLGTRRTFGFDVLHGQVHLADLSGGPCGAECSASSARYTYDANGYPASRTDFNGVVTTFVSDADGLEISRTEALGTAEERTITTQWHGIFRLPVLITEPGKTTAFTYDTDGRLLTRTETDTATGHTRTLTNAYDTRGLLTAIDGPRTDVVDVSTFAYDTRGNLTETTNALGQRRKVTAYDAHGRPLVLEDPHGLVTTLAYDARGRLLSRNAGGQVTRFAYDGAGNVTKTTLAGGSFRG